MRNLEVLRAVLGGQLLLSQHLGLRWWQTETRTYVQSLC